MTKIANLLVTSPSQPPALFSAAGNFFITIELAPRTYLQTIISLFDKPLEDFKLFVIILDGTLNISGINLKPDCLLRLTRINQALSGEQGCLLALITGEKYQYKESDSLIYHYTQLSWFDKYKAWVGKLSLNKDEKFLSPWSGYAIETGKLEEVTDVHIHSELNNLIFVKGSSKLLMGYFVFENLNQYFALPVVGGDIILVPPGIKHNLVAPTSNCSLSFFVFNDSSSDYEHEETSDYHIVESIFWQEIKITPRSQEKPLFINLGVT
jgi:mannose-6-phosphate isomerase-like protein (cupin superfamily)